VTRGTCGKRSVGMSVPRNHVPSPKKHKKSPWQDQDGIMAHGHAISPTSKWYHHGIA
jgi:hypothetical protein